MRENALAFIGPKESQCHARTAGLEIEKMLALVVMRGAYSII
jgi:hypothetical protein